MYEDRYETDSEDWMDRELRDILNDIQELESAGVDVQHLYDKYWPLYEDKAKETEKHAWFYLPWLFIGVIAIFFSKLVFVIFLVIAIALAIFSSGHLKKKISGRLKVLRSMTDKTMDLYYSGHINGKA